MTDRIYAEEGDAIAPDLVRAWCADRNIAVFVLTEGMDATAGPILCCAGPTALDLTDALRPALAATDLLECCIGADDLACSREVLEDQAPAVIATLRAMAEAAGVAWPDDLAAP